MELKALEEFLEEHFVVSFSDEVEIKEENSSEFKQVEIFLNPYLSKLKDVDEWFLIQSLIYLDKYLKRVKTEAEVNPDPEKDEVSNSFRDRFKMLEEFQRLMLCFVKDERDIKKGLFPINKIVFEGMHTNEVIELKDTSLVTLDGSYIDLFKELFKALNNLTSEQEEKLKAFSQPLFEIYHSINFEISNILNNDHFDARELRRRLELPRNSKAYFNKLKYLFAACIHVFLKKHSIKTSKAKIPSWHKKFIGEFYDLTGIDSYLGYSDDKKVANWIVRGMM